MWTPAQFAETDPDAIAETIEAARLATLVTHGPQGLYATHLPFLFEREPMGLVGPVARAHPRPCVDWLRSAGAGG